MKYIGKILVGIFLIGLAGCEPDFSDIAPNVSSDVNYLFSDSISIVVGNDGLTTINGKDSCFVELADGEDVVELNTLYSIGDKYFYGGITSYVKIHPLSEGVAHCRLFNTKYEFDTTISIIVSSGTTPGGETTSEYVISPSNTHFSITEGIVELTVTGPKPMGGSNLNTFVLFNYGGNVAYDDSVGAYVRKQRIQLSHVGSANFKFYNEGWDTIISIEVLPQYNTFTEPNLDFDDTRDSIMAKLGTPDSEDESNGTLTYIFNGPEYAYTLMIRLRDVGVVKDYDVTFADEAAKEELRLFVQERYYRYGTHNGYYIYTKGFNQTVPSPYSEGNTVLIENFLHGSVSYKNPSRSWEW